MKNDGNWSADEVAIDAVGPLAVPPKGGKRQQQKSADMRALILEATIDCLVAYGYAGLSTQRMLSAAKVSRGAMHHHFATKRLLVDAVVEYTFQRRIRDFLNRLEQAQTETKDAVQVAAEVHWQIVQTREYAAYLELAVAARTDPELNRSFLPAAQRYDRAWSAEMNKAFPDWSRAKLLAANDFAVAAHMGLLLNLPILADGSRLDEIQAAIVATIRRLHGDACGQTSDGALVAG